MDKYKKNMLQRRRYWRKKYENIAVDPAAIPECYDCRAGEIRSHTCIRGIYEKCWLNDNERTKD